MEVYISQCVNNEHEPYTVLYCIKHIESIISFNYFKNYEMDMIILSL